MKRPLPAYLVSLVLAVVATSSVRAGAVDSRVFWVAGKPHVEIAIDAKPQEGVKEIAVPVELHDAKGALLWAAPVKVPVTERAPWKARVPLQNIKEPNKPHQLTLSLTRADLEIDYREQIHFGAEAAAVQSYGLASRGVFPDRKVAFRIGLNGIRGKELRAVPVTLKIRDGEENVILNRQAAVRPINEPQLHSIDVTPDTSSSVGPYTLEVGLESDALSIFFNASLRFAQPNAVVPVSGMEHGDPLTWFASGSMHKQNPPPAPPPPGKVAMYYSPHLMDMAPRDTPKVTYDRAVKHSGRQSLRVDYPVSGTSYAWSLQQLPGKPLALALWVKGNGSKDTLTVHFNDNINHGLQAWHRNADFSSATICTLDFDGWRRFRVPVLGEGLQVSGLKGSTEKIDAPITILALGITPEPLPKGATRETTKDVRRSVWIDDVATETQVPPAELLSMELQASDAAGRLTPDGMLAVAVGNGYAEALKRGKVTLLARDVDAKPVLTRTVDLPVNATEFATVDLPLKDLAERRPRGPVEIDITFQDPVRPATRITRRLTLKAPRHAGVLFDFEEPATFSGYQPNKVGKSAARIVPGGAEGSAHALALPVVPKQEDNSVLFHPSLPGIVDHVEMMVHGGDRPVTLQPWFIDSGNTGIWTRNYNLLWAEPITVDWQGWRKVSVAAPPIPAYHGDKNRYFWNRPWYPLNLALNATTNEGEQPVEIRIDNVRVVTHLTDEEQLVANVDYPDETRIHAPGAPLRLNLINFAESAAALKVRYELRNYQGFVAKAGNLDLPVPPGAKQKATLIDALTPGIYDLRVQGVGQPLSACIMVLDARTYFGPEPLDVLTNSLLLRRQLGLTTEKLYMDWDNAEAAPHLYHYQWFEQELKKIRTIKDLPRDLEGLASRYKTATEAVAQADKDVKTAQNQSVNMVRNEKAASDKVANTTKLVTAAETEATALSKQLDDAKAKTTAAEKIHTDEKAKADEAAKVVAKLMQDAKTATAAVPVAEKAVRDAEAAAKTEDTKAKQAEDAAKKAKKEADDAEDAAKKAEKDMPGTQQAKDARTKADAAKKASVTATMQAEAARKLAKDKADEVPKAKTKLETARTELKSTNDKLTAAKQAQEQANKKTADAAKIVAQLKAQQNAADQKFQQARNKHTNLSKQLDNEKQQLDMRRKEARDAAAAEAKAKQTLDTARSELEAADKVFEAGKSKYYFTPLPVVGFAAEWAGPEAAESLQKKTYHRWIPNRIQVPSRMVDWSLFVRNVQREYKGRFDAWVFWENPDLDDSPQNIPPVKYATMFQSFAKWVKLYNPNARVVAGGFNFNKSLAYLQRIPEPHKLPFDELHVQMNLGELSPERADMEGYLDDLNDLLKIRETRRTVRLTELDWAIGKFLDPMQQAAYHARAALVLDSRGVPPHEFNLINSGFEFDGYGVFYRVPYGNTADLQTFKPCHVPKPSYFALAEVRKFLKDWKYVTGVNLSDKSLAHNRAFIYRNATGALTAVVWRAVDGTRTYRVPAAWRGVTARDVFGFTVALDQGLSCTPLPRLLQMPAGYQAEQLLHDLRTLQATDDSYPVILDLHLGEPDSTRRAEYQATGKTQTSVRGGAIPGDRKVRESYVTGLESEAFSFTLAKPGNALLLRRWYFDGEGQKLFVKLNDGPEQTWNLTKGQGNDAGVRESSFVLGDCKAGPNRVTIRYEKPGNSAGYRVEPLAGDHVALTRWGILNTRQTKGEVVRHTSAVGTPLMFGKTACEGGLGAHAVSFIEYPLDGQFRSFEVTVGIDGSTEGRGSVVFRIFVDGKEQASSGILSGFSKPKTLKIDNLDKAQRLILSVSDAEDGNRDDLANWVDGKLYLKGSKP
jgi:hypothetical protein